MKFIVFEKGSRTAVAGYCTEGVAIKTAFLGNKSASAHGAPERYGAEYRAHAERMGVDCSQFKGGAA